MQKRSKMWRSTSSLVRRADDLVEPPRAPADRRAGTPRERSPLAASRRAASDCARTARAARYDARSRSARHHAVVRCRSTRAAIAAAASSMPSPVSALTARRPESDPRGVDACRLDRSCSTRRSGSLACLVQQRAVLVRQRSLTDRSRAASGRRRFARAQPHALTPSRSTRSSVSRAARGIDQRHRDAFDVDSLRHAGRASCRGRASQSRVAPANVLNRLDLPTFGRPAIDHRRPLADQPPSPRVCEQIVDRGDDRVDLLAARARLDEMISLVGKIERRLEPRDQIEQRASIARDPLRSTCPRVDRTRLAPAAASRHRSDRATASACTRSSLPFRNARKREFAGLGQPRAGRDRAPQDACEHDRAAVRR